MNHTVRYLFFVDDNVHIFIFSIACILLALWGMHSNGLLIFVTFIRPIALKSKSNFLIGVLAVHNFLACLAYLEV